MDIRIVSCDIYIGQVYIGVIAVIRGSGYFTGTAEVKKAMVEAAHSIMLSYDGLVSEGNHTLFIK